MAVRSAEDRLDGVETFFGEAETIALASEGDVGVTFEYLKGDVGLAEGAGQEEGDEACAGDEDWFLGHSFILYVILYLSFTRI